MQLVRLNQKIIEYATKYKINNIEVSIYDNSQTHFISNNRDIELFEKAFQIASISKVFTALAIMIAVEDNKINLFDTIGNYFYNFSIKNEIATITIHELLTHTSGLPRLPEIFINKMIECQANPYSTITKADIYTYFENPQPINPKKYCYSNFGYGILSMIIERVYKINFSEFMKNKIFEPLLMNSTSINPSSINNKIIVQGYDKNNNHAEIWIDETLSGGGAVITTTQDYIKFISSHFYENKFSNALAKMQIERTKNMCYGWHRPSFFNRIAGLKNYLWHNGLVGGYSSYTAISKLKEKGIIILTNKAILIDDIGIDLIGNL